MKALTLLTAAFGAVMALQISTASSQETCLKGYQSCMNTCAKKGAANDQDGCFQSCQGRNDTCAQKVFGKRPANTTPALAAEPGAAKEALAKDVAPEAPQATAVPAPQESTALPQDAVAEPVSR